MIAVALGPIDAARKLSADASRLAPGEPLTLLLSAQAAQLSGDRDGAERAFRAMASRADTKALGLHGLFIEAHRRDDHESARAHAEEAAAPCRTPGWAGRAALEARCKDGDWSSALALLERHRGAMDKATYRRQRAVLLTARALAAEEFDREAARNDALEAVKLAPTLVPAVALAARLLAQGGYLRKANRIIDTAWRANPHPELAQSYAELRSSESARDRLKRIEPHRPNARLAMSKARSPLREPPSMPANSPAPAQRWRLISTRRPSVSRWRWPRSNAPKATKAAPANGWRARCTPRPIRMDRRRLRLRPLAAAVARHRPARRLRMARAAHRHDERRACDRVGKVLVIPAKPTAGPAVNELHDSDAPLAMNDSAAPPPPGLQPTQPKAEPVIPLVHAPDDPGPEAEIVEETEPEPDAKPSGWRKIFE